MPEDAAAGGNLICLYRSGRSGRPRTHAEMDDHIAIVHPSGCTNGSCKINGAGIPFPYLACGTVGDIEFDRTGAVLLLQTVIEHDDASRSNLADRMLPGELLVPLDGDRCVDTTKPPFQRLPVGP